jgi:hypothetical protein
VLGSWRMRRPQLLSSRAMGVAVVVSQGGFRVHCIVVMQLSSSVKSGGKREKAEVEGMVARVYAHTHFARHSRPRQRSTIPLRQSG